MSDLRSVGIEAMADAWARLEEGKDYEMSGVAWANLRAVAAVQLDALLGVLEEHADEWIEAEAVLQRHQRPTHWVLVLEPHEPSSTKPFVGCVTGGHMSLDALLYFLAGWGTWCIIRDIVRLREATTKKENSNDGNG